MSEADEQPGSAENGWGTHPTEQRQAELEGMLRKWESESDHGPRRSPFDGIPLNGAEVFWLTIQAAPDDISKAKAEQLLRGPFTPSPIGPFDLSKLHLDGAYLPGAHLEKADLRGAHLDGANLRGAHLDGADLRGAHLEKADLGAAHLEKIDFAGAYLDGAYLPGAYLDGAYLVGAPLKGVTLQAAHLKGANLRGAYLDRADLARAYLDGADLQGAHLEGAHLQGAHLEGAYLQEAYLKGAFLEAAHLEKTDLRKAILVDANLRGVNVTRASLQRANLYRADLREGEFDEADLRGSSLVAADLRGADLSRAIFDIEANLADAKLGDRNCGFASVIDTGWNGVILASVDWSGLFRKHWWQPLSGGKLGDDRRGSRLAARAHRQLALALRAQGLNAEAAELDYRAHIRASKDLWHKGQYLAAFASWLACAVFGYGYRLGRCFALYVGVVLLFSIIYRSIPYGYGARYSPHYLPWWPQALILSFTSFHGRGFLSSDVAGSVWHGAWAAGEAVVGLLIEVTLIATFTQRVFR